MKLGYRQFWRGSLSVGLLLLVVANLLPQTQVFAVCGISGNVFRDYNADGQDAGTLEPGVQNIQVTAFDATNTAVATTTTDIFGDYNITVPDNTDVRIEFVIPPTHGFLQSGAAGAGSLTNVAFADGCVGPSPTPINYGVNNPGQFCQENPDLITSRYLFGDQVAGPNATSSDVLTFPYNSGSTSLAANSAAAATGHTSEATAGEVGAVWGTAYQAASDSIFVASFIKRHVGLGPTDNPGTIYRIDRRTGAVSDYITLAAGANPHTPGGPNTPPELPYFDDIGAFNMVGFAGFGDLEMSDDETTLFAVNMASNTLHQITLGNPAGAAPLGITNFAIPAAPGCPGLSRPGALQFYDGVLYVGVTCTGPTVNDLRAHVFTFVGGFGGTVVNIPLNYNRGCASVSGGNCANAEWIPWVTDTNGDPNDDLLTFAPFAQMYAPQPWLLDIEIDEFGYMVLGLGDRAGHQMGNTNGLANSGPVEGVSAGDVLRLAPTGGTWTLENNGSSGVAGTPGAATTIGGTNNQGPGTGEFYFGERYTVTAGNASTGTHNEITLAGLAQVYGRGEVVAAAFDPAPQGNFRTGGVVMMSHSTGERTRSIEIFGRDAQGTFGKAAGIGDVEGMCTFAPIEIGNRVWNDLDNNGRQDPGEPTITGIVVSLYVDTDGDGVPDTKVADVPTDANGRYIFNAATLQAYLTANGLTPQPGVHFFDINGDGVLNGLEQLTNQPNTDYEIRIEDASNFGGGSPLDNFFMSPNDADTDVRDSDGTVVDRAQLVSAINFPRMRFRTGNFGANNHSYDFGFTQIVPPTTTTTTTGGTTTGVGGTTGGVAGAGSGTVGNPATLSPEQIAKIPSLPATGDSPYARVRVYMMVLGILLVGSALSSWLFWRLKNQN